MGKKHNTKDGIEYNAANVVIQEDSSFPVDGHHAILNKANK